MKRSAPLVFALLICTACWLALSTSAQRASFFTPTRHQTPTRAQITRQSNASARAPRTLDNFDIRADLQRALDEPPDTASALNARQLNNRAGATTQRVFRLQSERPRLHLRWSSMTATPSRVWSEDQGLTGPSTDDAEIIARRFLKGNNDLYRLTDDEVEGLRVARRYRTEHNGLTHLTLEQRIGGIEVFHSQLALHLDRAGAIIATSGELLPDAARAVNLTRPRLVAAEVLQLAAQYADTELTGPLNLIAQAAGAEQRQEFDRAAGLARDASARLVYFPLNSTQVRLAWEFILWMNDSPDAYLMLVDAERGSLLYRYNLTAYDENPLKPHGQVYTGDSPRPDAPHTSNSPPIVMRQDVPFHATAFNGSTTFGVSDRHYDWWVGAAATGLISNNVDAHLDRDATANQPDLPRLTAADGNFSFPIDLTQAPIMDTNQKAAQVNLFYWVNRYHDILYSFGFTEAAGNFQTSNFGLGGAENDAVQADAQDGSGTNNANFSTPPDGRAGRVQMYLWSGAPQLDGDLDQGVILHELTHGLSNRLIGNGTGLAGTQGGGMGEGWSDYFGIVLMRTENDNVDGNYGVGQYVRNNYAVGIRRYPYSTSLAVNPLTFGNISLNTEVHAVGEIWCNTLLEMRALLIKKYGFQEGQRQSLQLVVDGLKLTPVVPTFLDARDAILLADRVNNGGANQCLLWQAFSKRGMGYSASTKDATDGAPKEAFDVPPYCNDTGSLQLDKRNYVVGEILRITLGDHNAAAPVSVQVRSSVTGDQETVTLTPDPVFTGSFNGTIRLAAGRANAGDGALQAAVEVGDQITVTYNDNATASSATAQVKATAGVVREKTVFEDHVELGNQGWIASGTWAITSTRSASSSHCWTDSPAGDYPNSNDTSLISPLFDLTNLSDVALTFAHSFALERGFDFGIIEYSIDDGATWSRATAFTGTQASFTQARIPLDALANQARARIRFRLTSDTLVTADGWYIDDIRLTARSANAAIIPPSNAQTPVISSLTPAFGPPAGGTSVTITGANFTESEDTTVTFDGIPASSIKVLGSTTIVVTTPPHTAGTATMYISNRNGAAALAGGFTYYLSGSGANASTLSKVFPVSGSTKGGTVVTLIGTNFTPETSVSFGSRSATAVTFVNANTLRAVTPSASAPGAVDVSVSGGSIASSLTSAFNYTAPTPPTVQVLSPTDGDTVYTESNVVIRWKSSGNRPIVKHFIVLSRPLTPQVPSNQTIVTDLPGDAQSYVWKVPSTGPITNAAWINVIAIDDEGGQTGAVSSGTFRIAKRWEPMADMGVARQRLAVATDGKYIYAIGGRTSATSSTTVATVDRFDPAQNSWIILSPSVAPPPLPTGLNGGEAVFLNGKIYLPGGFTSASSLSQSHFVFDVTANTWSNAADVPAGLFLYALAADGARGVYYLTGGNNNIGGAVATVRAYNPATNAWSDLPPMSRARYGHEAAMIDGKLYVVGGFGTTGGLSSGEVYDFTTQKWSPIASLSRPRNFAASGVGKDPAGNPLWFVAGGEDPSNNTPFANMEVYDVRNNRWITLDNSFNMSIPHTQVGSVVLGGMLYVVAGATPLTTTTTVSTNHQERLQIDGTSPVGLDQPPVLAVPSAQVAMPGAELKFNVTANDLGSGVPLTLTAEGMPTSAAFTFTSSTNNSARGTFRWTPATSDVGKTVALTFTASDGQLSDTRVVNVRVVEAGPLAAVSAANYRGGSLALDSIASAFGNDLAVRVEGAQTLPLPTELAGTTVTINGVPAPLFFVSPTQINFAVPASLELGSATIVVSNALGTFSLGQIQLTAAAPAIFTVDSTGTGDAAAVATADGINYQTAPFDVMVNGHSSVLLLYGTGLRHAAAANPNDENGVAESVTITIGGQPARVWYVGAQPDFIGLDQINVEIPASLVGSGTRRVEVVLSLNGVEANRVTIMIK